MIRGGYWGGSWGLSWAGAWGEAWLLLNQPYQELSLKGQVFVRSYLTRIHSVEVAEQIVTYAHSENVSVLEARRQLVVTTDQSTLTISRKAQRQAKTPKPMVRGTKPARKLPASIFVISAANEVYAKANTENYTVMTTIQPVVSSTGNLEVSTNGHR